MILQDLMIFGDSLSNVNPGDLPHAHATQYTVDSILAIVFGIIGAFALLTITISGLRYVVSAGSPERASKAKNGIIYSLVGLAIAILAEAIIAFVVKRI